MKNDQFDLEQGIMSCWNVTSDLNVLFENLVENSDMTLDKASNIVLGLNELYELKFSALFRTFEEFLKSYYEMSKKLERLENGSPEYPKMESAEYTWTFGPENNDDLLKMNIEDLILEQRNE